MREQADKDVAIRMSGVTKEYRLYPNRKAMVLDRLGLAKFLNRKSSYETFHALKNIDLVVNHGQKLGVVGRNGAGKTTLLKLITGNFLPTAGKVSVTGSVQALMRTGLGFYPEFTGYQNIESSLTFNGLKGTEFEEALDDVVDFVELGRFLHQPMKNYSAGMRARVQFATATAIKPDILIVDEVLGAGDSYFSGKSAHRMDKLVQSGCTLLLVSHSVPQVLQFCEDAIWINEGQIISSGSALEVVREYEEYIQRISREEHADSNSHEKRAGETVDWQRERMLSLITGSDVPAMGRSSWSNWPSEGGLAVHDVHIRDAAGNDKFEHQSGDPLSIEISVKAQKEGLFDLTIAILIMTLDGIKVCRHLSEPEKIQFSESEIRVISVEYDELLFARGDYVVSVGLFKNYDPMKPDESIRYDLLSRSVEFKVRAKGMNEPGLFHHPCRWSISEPGESETVSEK